MLILHNIFLFVWNMKIIIIMELSSATLDLSCPCHVKNVKSDPSTVNQYTSIWPLGLSLLSEGEGDTRLVFGFKHFMLRWGTELNWQLYYSLMAVLWFSNVCSDQVWHTVLRWNGEMLLQVKELLSYLPVRNKRREAVMCHGWFVWLWQVAVGL